MNAILVAAISVSGLGLICAVILVIFSKLMEVKVNPKIEEVREALPGANCGACGCAGCDEFSKAVVEDGAEPSRCTVGGESVATEVAKIMGITATVAAKKVAALMCQGSDDVTNKKLDYDGVTTCKGASMMHGGTGDCSYGCLGLGDCVNVCDFDAMYVENGIVRINEDKCTACGACVKVCPKTILTIIEKDKAAMVQCNNRDKGAVAKKQCKVACITCSKCVKACPENCIEIVDNVAVIDRSKCIMCGDCVVVCPSDCINLK